MKFQIILESTDPKKAQMACDDFEKLVKRNVKLPGFKVVRAENLDGMKREAWDPQEKLKMQVRDLQNAIEVYRSVQVKNKRPTAIIKSRTRIYKDPLE